MIFDVAIVGSGPAGASCAAFCARAGLRTLLLEREKFPREKVCGDCLNPACWPVLERLGIAEAVRALPHGKLEQIDFVLIGGRTLSVPLAEDTEIAIKRSLLDQLLLTRAHSLGATVFDNATVSELSRSPDGWNISTRERSFQARALVAADGRNSSVARSLGLLPPPAKERVGLQTHCALPKNFGPRVVLQFLPEGYSGQAPVGHGELNLCLVAEPPRLASIKAWAEQHFELPSDHTWRTITPLRRAALVPAFPGLFLVGDAARVVEPFTGEGIFYALRSGELAAEAIARGSSAREYAAEHAELYRGRLWINRLARAAVLSPVLTSFLLSKGLFPQALLRRLSAKVSRRAMK